MNIEGTFKKLREVLFKHKIRLDNLEKRIESLEQDPWKMPFDNG